MSDRSTLKKRQLRTRLASTLLIEPQASEHIAKLLVLVFEQSERVCVSLTAQDVGERIHIPEPFRASLVLGRVLDSDSRQSSPDGQTDQGAREEVRTMYTPLHEDSTFSLSVSTLFLSPFLVLAQCAIVIESRKSLTGS